MARSPEVEHPQKAFGWAARDNSGTLSPFNFSRRDNGEDDVTIKILYCGVCHSDLHSTKNDWGFTSYPVVPGHEIVGAVTAVGNNVNKFKVDDKAFGLKVTVISTSPKKESEAIDRLGADSFLVSTDPAKFKAAIGTMDYIIDTIAAVHALAPLLSLLNVNGKLVTVGLPEKPLELPIFPLVIGRRLIGGSNVGGIKETQEMLDFCSKHNITADIELIQIDELNEAMERLAKSDVRYELSAY
ncbi:hypothetical protein LWI28_021291 [Acer negundo]|uniref:Alcohol dehydrogenase-like C-terminal domain-containing protein n=1 Tax=Acer negundo TaxID=4023 RepID=A0AAD5IP75_ACENE|nr:hypothetical protein LWI28_021291 [Acer negundo]